MGGGDVTLVGTADAFLVALGTVVTNDEERGASTLADATAGRMSIPGGEPAVGPGRTADRATNGGIEPGPGIDVASRPPRASAPCVADVTEGETTDGAVDAIVVGTVEEAESVGWVSSERMGACATT